MVQRLPFVLAILILIAKFLIPQITQRTGRNTAELTLLVDGRAVNSVGAGGDMTQRKLQKKRFCR